MELERDYDLGWDFVVPFMDSANRPKLKTITFSDLVAKLYYRREGYPTYTELSLTTTQTGSTSNAYNQIDVEVTGTAVRFSYNCFALRDHTISQYGAGGVLSKTSSLMFVFTSTSGAFDDQVVLVKHLVPAVVSGVISANVVQVEGSDAVTYYNSIATAINQNTASVGNSINANINDGVSVVGEVDANVVKITGISPIPHAAGCFPTDLRYVHGSPLSFDHTEGYVPTDIKHVEGVDAATFFSSIDDATITAVNAARDSVTANVDAEAVSIRSALAGVLSSNTLIDGERVDSILEKLKSHITGKYSIAEIGGGAKRVNFYNGAGTSVLFSCEVSNSSRVPV